MASYARSLRGEIPGMTPRLVVGGLGAVEKASVAIPAQHGTRAAGRLADQFQALALGQRSVAVEWLYGWHPAFCVITNKHSITTSTIQRRYVAGPGHMPSNGHDIADKISQLGLRLYKLITFKTLNKLNYVTRPFSYFVPRLALHARVGLGARGIFFSREEASSGTFLVVTVKTQVLIHRNQ